MENNSHHTVENIDFPKLKAIFLKNRIWILFLVLLCNLVAYLFVRYTKDVFEASAEIKLELNNEANEFGITKIIEDQNLNLLSGEIELIQSNLFLGRVIDSLKLDVSYFSKGSFLDFELYKNSPFRVVPIQVPSTYANVNHIISEINDDSFELTFDNGLTHVGRFGVEFLVNDLKLKILRTPPFEFEEQNTYTFILNDQQSLRAYFTNGLTVAPKNFNANTIRIAFKEFHAGKAMDVVNKIVSVYRSFSYEQKNFANRHKIEWVNHELAQIEEKMERYENYFKDFTLENKTQNLSDDIARTINEINSIDTFRYVLKTRLKLISDLRSDLAQKKSDRPIKLSDRAVLPTEVVQAVLDYHQKLVLLNEVKLSYKETSFSVKQLQNDINFIVDRLNSQLLELEIIAKDQLIRYETRLKRLEYEFMNMPDKTTEYSKNQRYYKLYEEFYFTLMQSRSEFEIAQAGTIPDFKILAGATLPTRPISPNRMLIAGIGFTSGLVVVFFFIGILYLLDDRITSVQELERIDKVSILGIIPAFRSSRSNGLPVQSQPHSMVAESIRTLRTNLDFFNSNRAQKVITISSTVSGEGKSFVARNLGAVIAMSGKKVVLVDLDMRKPKDDQAPPFNNKSLGVSSVLINKIKWQECLHTTAVSNFDVIPAGPHPPNPSELLVNGLFERLINELREAYDYVIIDTPPVGIVTDGIMAMKRADICIYLFRANYSKKEFINNLKRINMLHNFSNVTAILNALPSTAQTYGYGYYHEEKKSKYFESIFFKD